jgi:hypothetical protein
VVEQLRVGHPQLDRVLLVQCWVGDFHTIDCHLHTLGFWVNRDYVV